MGWRIGVWFLAGKSQMWIISLNKLSKVGHTNGRYVVWFINAVFVTYTTVCMHSMTYTY